MSTSTLHEPIERQFTYRPLSTQEDQQQLSRLVAQCFNESQSRSDDYFERIGRENFRLLQVGEAVAGGLALLPMGQWWSGQRVPMMGIASVGVAPEYRGSGAAIALMQQMLLELHEQNIPLSVLYAAAQRLYRRAGYEQAGSACGWEIETDSIALRDRPLDVCPIALDADRLSKLYQPQAIAQNGNLDRHPALWKMMLVADDALVYAYEFGKEGYIIFQQKDSVLKVIDWVVLTPAAGQTFWSFLSDHRSMISKVQWKSSAIDPLTLLLPEQTWKPRFIERWMLRIVDVAAALKLRGYASDVTGELHLEVQDDLIAANCDRFCLTVAEGRAQVTRGGRGDLKLDVRGLAPLYTNLFSASQLQRLGRLEASPASVQLADRIFAAAAPWMPDFF